MRSLANVFLILAAVLSSAAQAQQDDVGLVNQLSGEVSYQSPGGAAKAHAFMKVRQGDRFTLPSGAQLRLVYFQGGRQEAWSGPASFRAGARQSDVLSGQPSSVTTLPGVVHQKIAQVPELLRVARMGRTGGVAVRGVIRTHRLTPEQETEVAGARAAYAKLRAQSSPDDITPELYLFSALQDYSQFEAMKSVAEEMAKRQPASSEVRELLDWVKSKTQ